MDRNDGGNAQCTIDFHSIRSVSTRGNKCPAEFDYILAARVTCQTLMTLSVYPANSVCPSEDQAKEIH